MNVLLINLDRSSDRLTRMAPIFEDAGVDFSRVSAVDGNSLPEASLRRQSGKFYQLRRGEIACFLSHRQCWQIAASGHSRHTAIFEDDVHFGQDIGQFLRNDMWIPEDADIVKLETTFVRTVLDRPHAVHFGRSLRRMRTTHAGGAGYIVSSAAARKLLDWSAEFVDPVDQFLFNADCVPSQQLRIYQVDPAICIQDMFVAEGRAELPSTLESDRPEAKAVHGVAKLTRELTRPLKRAWYFCTASVRGGDWKRVKFR